MGAMMVREAADKLGTDKKREMLLEHMILSHHGEPEFGAAVRPLFLEAELLSELDLMDARVYQIHEAITPLKRMISPAGFGHLTIEKYIITDLPIIKRM